MTGGSGDRPCGRGTDCRPEASSGLMGRRKSANSHTGQSREKCRSDASSGQTVWGKGASSPTGRSGNCRPDASSGVDGVGKGRRFTHRVKPENCRPDASAELTGAGTGRQFTHRAKPENCRPDIAPGQALHGRRAFLCRGGGTIRRGLHVIIEEKPPGVDRQGADQKGETDNGD